MISKVLRKVTAAVITVGAGRGFVVEHGYNRIVLTAAHCLPFLPPHSYGMSELSERTYKALLAPLGSEPAIWAECLFANPIADIAVLGSPDNQELCDEADAYETLMESTTPPPIADAPENGHGWMLSLDNEWFQCDVEYMCRVDGELWISNATQPIVGGMSGSPVLSEKGEAIGIVALSVLGGDACINPRLVRDLPGWLLR